LCGDAPVLRTPARGRSAAHQAPNGGPWWPSNFDRIWRRFKKK